MVWIFLQYLFNFSVSYSSISTARSALSFILPRNGYGSFGQHFLVKKFIRGVSNLRTPVPKYSYIWDVLVLLEFFRHLPENNLLSLKLLSLKLVMLIALVSAVPNLRYFSKTTTTGPKNFLGPPGESGGMPAQKILKMKVLKLAKIAFQTALYWKSVYRQ